MRDDAILLHKGKYTGATSIYIENSAASLIYSKLCGSEGYFIADGSFYVSKTGAERLKSGHIYFSFGEVKVELPVDMLKGGNSIEHQAFFGSIQAKGAGTTLDDTEWTHDIYGTVRGHTYKMTVILILASRNFSNTSG